MESVRLFDPYVCFDILFLDMSLRKTISQSCFYHGGDELGKILLCLSYFSCDQEGPRFSKVWCLHNLADQCQIINTKVDMRVIF